MSEPKTIQVEINVDASAAIRGLRKADRDIARLMCLAWRWRPDPNPMPRFRLFRWLP